MHCHVNIFHVRNFFNFFFYNENIFNTIIASSAESHFAISKETTSKHSIFGHVDYSESVK